MATQHYRSAGVVVFRRSVKSGQREYLLLDYGKHWDFPKGHVEEGEDDQTAALRELAEETGIKDARLVDGFSHLITYFFRDRAKKLIHKQVIFFAAETRAKRIRLSYEHVGAKFLAFDAALKRATYPKAKEVLNKAEEYLTGQQSDSTGGQNVTLWDIGA